MDYWIGADQYNVFDVIKFKHYVSGNIEYLNGIGIILFDMKKNRKYLFCLEHDEVFYVSNMIGDVRESEKIEIGNDDLKIDMIQEANYVSYLDHMQSRWFKDEINILKYIWKNINKKKKYLEGRFAFEYIRKTKTKLSEHTLQYIANIFILNFTKSKLVSKEYIKKNLCLG
jgi:hypothetical protein